MKHTCFVRRIASLIFILTISLNLLALLTPPTFAQPTWPEPWIEIDWDKNENGGQDDMRDVEYAYYQFDADYLYLKLRCYGLPGGEWPSGDARYKWFIDFDGNMYYSGGNIFDAEYLLFVEDTDHDGAGDMFLVADTNGDGDFGEHEPWPPENYADHRIIDADTGGWRIVVATNQIEMYINWTAIGNPTSYGLFWATDQQNPNLDQGPTTDRVDEEQIIIVHNVAAVSQIPSPTVVSQGENVTVQVTVENRGTQAEVFNVTCYFNNTEIGTKLADLSAGRQTSLTFDWNTTGLPVGNYTITAWADSSATIIETDEEDNWCSSTVIVTIQPAPVHDVAAVSQVPDKVSVVQGTVVNINVTVSNLGDFVETFNVTCYYSSNLISYQTVTSLLPLISTSLNFAWDTTGVMPSTYYIRATADSGNIISEVDEINNNCTSFQTVTVYSPSQMGSLFVDKTKTAIISGEDPPVVGLSTIYELTIVVTNVGGSAVSNIQVNETISHDVTFVSVETPSQGSITAYPPPRIVWDVGTLSPGGNATLTFRIDAKPTSVNQLFLNHKENLTGTGIDTLTGNPVTDVADTDITVTPIIRDVAAISQIPSSTTVSQGDTVAVEVTIKNNGNVSETFDVTCYFDSNPINVMRVYNLEAAGQTVISFAWDTTGVTPSTYSITAEADSNSEISETDETNNECTSLTEIKVVIRDVAIVSQAPSPTILVQGEIVTIEVVVKNEGTELETFVVSCYYNDTLLEEKTVTNLGSNDTSTLNFFWDTTGVPVGTYFVNTAASIVPNEKDTDDNACRSTTSVEIALPQYQITFDQSGVGSDFLSAVVVVDGIDYGVADLPISFAWDAGSTHTFAFQSPLTVALGNKQHIWTSTDGLSTSQTAAIVTTGSGSINGSYKTQYFLTVTTDPTDLVTIPGGGWHDVSTDVLLNAPPVLDYDFLNWAIDGTSQGSGVNPVTVQMNAARTATAHYLQRTVEPLSVSITPLSATILAGQSVAFTSNVSGGTPLFTYQWYLDGTPVSGATSDSWVFTPSGSGIYYVHLRVTDVNNITAQSETARVEVISVPVGGYSVPMVRRTPILQFTGYFVLIAFFGIVASLVKRKRK